MNAITQISASATGDAKLRRAAEDFTAVALGALLQPMFDSAGASAGMFDGGEGEQTWRPMMVQEIAKSIAHQGGFGLSDVVANQMLRLQEASS